MAFNSVLLCFTGNLGYSLDSSFLVASVSLTVEKVRKPTLLQELSKCWGEGKHVEAKKKKTIKFSCQKQIPESVR